MQRFIALSTVVMLALLCTTALAHHKLGHLNGPGMGNLPAPQDLVCPVADGVIMGDWSDVEGATKYAVQVVGSYDTNGDGVDDATADYEYNTADVEGMPDNASEIDIALADLEIAGAVLVAVDVRVKAMNPGRGMGRQNHPFSAFCSVVL